MDLMATFLDYAGIEVPPGIDSRSLRPLLGGDPDAYRTHASSGLREWRMVCDGRYKLVRGFRIARPDRKAGSGGTEPQDTSVDKSVLLFDLAQDHFETDNLAERLSAEVARLTQWLPPLQKEEG